MSALDSIPAAAETVNVSYIDETPLRQRTPIEKKALTYARADGDLLLEATDFLSKRCRRHPEAAACRGALERGHAALQELRAQLITSRLNNRAAAGLPVLREPRHRTALAGVIAHFGRRMRDIAPMIDRLLAVLEKKDDVTPEEQIFFAAVWSIIYTAGAVHNDWVQAGHPPIPFREEGFDYFVAGMLAGLEHGCFGIQPPPQEILQNPLQEEMGVALPMTQAVPRTLCHAALQQHRADQTMLEDDIECELFGNKVHALVVGSSAAVANTEKLFEATVKPSTRDTGDPSPLTGRFGPALCLPVVRAVDAHQKKLPAADVFSVFLEARFAQSLPPYSEKIPYYLDLFGRVRRHLMRHPDLVPEAVQQAFDPAMQFFCQQLMHPTGTSIQCAANEPNPPIQTLPSPPTNPQEVAQYLTQQLRLSAFTADQDWPMEDVPGHRLFYARIAKESPTVVMLVPESHDSREQALDYLRLFNWLSRQPERIQPIIGLEAREEFFQQELARARRAASQPTWPQSILHQIRNDWAEDHLVDRIKTLMQEEPFLEAQCGPRESANFHFCVDYSFVPTTLRLTYFGVLGTSDDTYWPLDDEQMSIEHQKLQRVDTPELTKRGAWLTRERSIFMANQLAQRIERLPPSPKKPCVVLFRVGAGHIPDIIHHLPSDLPVSVIGLFPHHFLALKTLAKQ
ncbi:MAG: hypothetical protein HYV02_02960 [Deltaproteobacteria bacterium]|nr:hypothetical protein [Deltaproteobacteria bacterium]